MYLDPARTELARHFDWYDGKLDSLFYDIVPTAVNGLGIIGPENIINRFNYFQALSKFFSSAVEADLPSLECSCLERLISKAATHWSVASECCLVGFPAEGNKEADLSVVRPDYVHPVYDKYNNDLLERILFIYPERQDEDVTFLNEVTGTDSALVVEYDVATGKATQSMRDYAIGYVSDTPRGAAEAINIGTVKYIKTGPPIYPTVEPLVREICVRLNMLQLALNTTSLPIIQINKDDINDGSLMNQQVTLEMIKKAATGPLGVNVPTPNSGEQGASYVERAGRGLEESMGYVRMLLSQMSILSSVPDYVFGINLAKPNAETERVLFSAASKVNQFRRMLDNELKEFGVEVAFTDNPFTTSTERNKVVLDQLAAGVLSVEEARIKLNIDGPTPPPNNNDGSTPSPNNNNNEANQ